MSGRTETLGNRVVSDEPRSTKVAQARLTAKLRAEHKTWVEVAEYFAGRYRVTMLVAFRLAHGWSQRHAAEQWNQRWPDQPKTLKSFSYWENWPSSTGHEPSLGTLDRLAQLYECRLGDRADFRHLDDAARLRSTGPDRTGVGPEVQVPDNLAALVGCQLEALTAAGGRMSGGPRERDRACDQLVGFFRAWAHTVRRRAALRALGWAATAAATPLVETLAGDEQVRVVSALQAPGRVDGAVVGHIEEVLWRCLRQDDALGPQAVLDTVLAQRKLVRTLLPECPPTLRARLLSLFANLSRIAGWLAFDLTDFEGAGYFYEQARSAAHEAENTELGTAVLCGMSQLATWQSQPRLGIDHAVAAQSWAKRIDDPQLRAYTFDMAARAYAFDGQHSACLTELENAGKVVSTMSQRSLAPSSLVYGYGPGAFASTQSACFSQLADTARTIAAASASLTLLDPSFVRLVAFARFDLVGAYTQRREVDHAAQLLGDTAVLVAQNRSVRLVGQLHDRRTQLEQWKRTRAVRALDDKLWAHGLAGSIGSGSPGQPAPGTITRR